MKSVMRTIVRIVTANKRNWTYALKPKGAESDYNDFVHVIGKWTMNSRLIDGF